MRIIAVPLTFVGLFWLALSGHYVPLILAFGALSCALVCFIVSRMDIVDNEGRSIHLVSWRVIPYIAWLAKEIIVSSVTVARIALSPKLKLRPAVASVDAQGMKEVEKVNYANSITLTPGTLTLNVDDDSLLVHTVREDMLESLHSGEMANRIKKTTIQPK